MTDPAMVCDFARRAELISDLIARLERDMAIYQKHIASYEQEQSWYPWYARAVAKITVLCPGTSDLRTYLRKASEHGKQVTDKAQ